MADIYRQKRLAQDERIGQINENGEIYLVQTGRDQYLGRVNYEDGTVYRHVTGPDELLGKVDDAGKVYYEVRLGRDDYLGTIKDDGSIMRHVSLRPDEYVGQVRDMRHKVEGAAALLFFFTANEQSDTE